MQFHALALSMPPKNASRDAEGSLPAPGNAESVINGTPTAHVARGYLDPSVAFPHFFSWSLQVAFPAAYRESRIQGCVRM